MEDSEIVLTQKEHNQTWEERLGRIEDSGIVLSRKEQNQKWKERLGRMEDSGIPIRKLTYRSTGHKRLMKTKAKID